MDNIEALKADEAGQLRPLLEELAAHHNAVSLHHSGAYPVRPIDRTLQFLAQRITEGQSQVGVLRSGQDIAGFCEAAIEGEMGHIGFLVVRKACRGQGLGKRLMAWAMDIFRQQGIRRIEVKVVAGNPALYLYESFGFEVNAYLLWHTGDKPDA